MLDILDEGVTHLPDFDSTQDLGNLTLFDSISSLLQFIELSL